MIPAVVQFSAVVATLRSASKLFIVILFLFLFVPTAAQDTAYISKIKIVQSYIHKGYAC